MTGDYLEPGPATAWFRPRHPLVAGEEPSPLARVMLAADAGNGVSAALDWSRYPVRQRGPERPSLRLPRGEWVCLDAGDVPRARRIGVAESALFDEQGRIGLAAQTLVIRPRAG